MHRECAAMAAARPLVFLAASLAAAASPGAGFYLSEVGTPGSLGAAGVGNPTNTRGPDSAWTNPAGMTGIDRPLAAGGMTFVLPSIEFDPSVATAGGDDGGNAGSFATIPGGFYVHPLGDRLRLGIGMAAPLGGGFDFGDDFVGRYVAQKVKLLGLGMSTSLGYKVNDRFSVGAGMSVIYTQFEQRLAINQGALPDAKLHIDRADDWGVQGYFGVNWQMSERLRLGVTYRSEYDANLDGDVTIQGLAIPLKPVGTLELDWTNPQLVDVGVRFAARDDVDLMASAGWQEWSAFSANQIAITSAAGASRVSVIDRQFKDTWNVGLAVEKRFGSSRALTFGVKYDSSPVSDANRTLDLPFDENWTFSAGYGWSTPGKVDLGFGASVIYAGEGSVDQVSQGVRVAGEFDSNFIVFLGGTMRYRF